MMRPWGADMLHSVISLVKKLKRYRIRLGTVPAGKVNTEVLSRLTFVLRMAGDWETYCNPLRIPENLPVALLS